jgi:preprotein translocase subunit SecE
VARNRKRAKERRARRPQPVATARPERDDPPTPIRHSAPDVELAEAQLALGRPELVSEPETQPEPEPADEEQPFEPEDEEQSFEPADEEQFEPEEEDELEPADTSGGRGGRGGRALVRRPDGGGGEAAPLHPAERARPGSRLIHFLQGSWRELQRVQWPDRRQVIQATGVVIGFVIVAGVYLGLADTVASRLVNFILK